MGSTPPRTFFNFEAMHICSTCSKDVPMVLRLPSYHTDLKVTTLYWQSHDVGRRLPAAGFYLSFLLLFRFIFFLGPISIRIYILWAQLLLGFSTDHLETMRAYSIRSENVHMVFGLSCHYLFFFYYYYFFFALFQLIFFTCDTMTWIACESNSSYSFKPILLKPCRCFCHCLKMSMCFWGYPLIIFYHFLDVFRYKNRYLVGAIHPTVFQPSFLNYAYLFFMVWRCACVFGLSSHYFFIINFFHFLWLSFFPSPVSIGKDTLWAQFLLEFSTDHFEKYANLFYMVWKCTCGFVGIFFLHGFINSQRHDIGGCLPTTGF